MHEINIHPDVKWRDRGRAGYSCGNPRGDPVKKHIPAEWVTGVKA